MPDRRRYHVSSAVVATVPGRMEAVAARLPEMEGVDVHAAESDRIVITIEGWSTGDLGDRLTAISLWDGVVAANMVFEHAEDEEEEAPT